MKAKPTKSPPENGIVIIETKTLEELYPAVDLAYPIALASYESIIKRLDALDGRIQGLMTFAATVMVAVPTIANNKGLSFKSGWFMTALVLFVIAISFGIAARIKGKICVISPATLYEHYLHLSEWEFKKDTIYLAGKHLKLNNQLLEKRHQYLMWMLIFFLAEVVALVVWVVKVSPFL